MCGSFLRKVKRGVVYNLKFILYLQTEITFASVGCGLLRKRKGGVVIRDLFKKSKGEGMQTRGRDGKFGQSIR